MVRREMPPRSYLLLHEHARLTDDEREELARGLHATFGLPWRETATADAAEVRP